MSTEQFPQQAWGTLEPGDAVLVALPGRDPYPAKIDVKTADSTVVWVIDKGGNRQAFDHREGIQLIPSGDSLLQTELTK